MADSAPLPGQPPARKYPEVENTTGQKIQLLHKREKDFYEEARDKYKAEYTFTNANDWRTLDRLLNLEVTMFRYQWYTLAGIDYDGVLLDSKDEAAYRQALKDLQAQIAACQKDLGVTKAEREKSMQVDNAGTYITELLQRAREFGVNREKQLDKALELMNELISVVGAFKRSNENERRKLGFENADTIIDWIQDYIQPEYEAVDLHFQEHHQRYWVRKV